MYKFSQPDGMLSQLKSLIGLKHAKTPSVVSPSLRKRENLNVLIPPAPTCAFG